MPEQDWFAPNDGDGDPLWLAHTPFAADLVAEANPRTILDIGLSQRHSIHAFSMAMMKARPTGGSITGLRPLGRFDDEVESDPLYREIVRKASDYAPTTQIIAERLGRAADQIPDESIDMIHLDGFKSSTALRDAMTLFVPKLSDRGVLLIHGITRFDTDTGIWRLWRDMISAHRHLTLTHAGGLGVAAIGANAVQSCPAFFGVPLAEMLDLARKYAREGKAALLEHTSSEGVEAALASGTAPFPTDLDLSGIFGQAIMAARW